MTAQHPNRDDVPEADLLEQQAPVDPPALPDTEAALDSDPWSVFSSSQASV